MAHKIKPLFQQVMVLVGATTDIGVTTVHRAVEQGMKVFMIDKDEDALQVIQDEMRNKGYDTAYAVADTGETEQLQFAADQCVTTFGGIDTWVNIPAIAEVPPKNQFEVHYWGMVNGSQVATTMMREKGGVIINVGSAYRSEVAPGEHIDQASKEAVKGYSLALRKDLKSTKSPVEVSLVLSSSPDLVAQGILRCAEKPAAKITPRHSLFVPLREKFFPKGEDSRKGLVASGIAGLSVAGGMAFFLMRKFRVI